LQADRAGLIEYAIDQGFMPCTVDPKEVLIRRQRSYAAEQDARIAIRVGTNNVKTVFSYHKIGNRYFVYVFNKEHQGSEIRYILELDNQGNCMFPSSVISLDKSKMIVEVV